MTTSSGTIDSTMTFFPFGTGRTGDVSTDRKFTGQRLDDTGLYYYGARHYDAGIGRFISADTVVPQIFNPQSLNRYSYCLNNPLKYIDPSGHRELLDPDQPNDGPPDPPKPPWKPPETPKQNEPEMPVGKEEPTPKQSNITQTPNENDQTIEEDKDYGKIIAGYTIIVVVDIPFIILNAAVVLTLPESLPLVPIIEVIDIIPVSLTVFGCLLINEGNGGWSVTDWMYEKGTELKNWIKNKIDWLP